MLEPDVIVRKAVRDRDGEPIFVRVGGGERISRPVYGRHGGCELSETMTAAFETSEKLADLPALHQKLREGAQIRAFLSGGGLRVVRVEINGDLVGYGESPHIEDALILADEDCAAGGREYDCVWLTGSISPSSVLDTHVRMGRKFVVYSEGDRVVAELRYMVDVHMPADLRDRAFKGEPSTWEHRGFRYSIEPSVLPNGTVGASMKCLNPGEGIRHMMYDAMRKGEGDTMQIALYKAFMAEEAEVSE